jgi:hypothetical protein
MRNLPVFNILLLAGAVSSTAHAAKSATFTYQQPVNGQHVRQEVTTHTRLQTTFTQSNQLISSETKNRKTEQVREVDIIEADSTKTAKVRVTYTKAMQRNGGKLSLGRAEPQPVANKTYSVSRVQEADELVITYPDGTKPPADELVIVASNMQSVGKTNPLAQFLNGRTVQVGEQLTMPPDLAADLLGSSMVQNADSVTLKLLRLQRIGNQTVGVFQTTILGALNEAGQREFDCQGNISVAVGTCRTLRIEMEADVSMTEERGPSVATFEVTNEGQVEIEMAAYYEEIE